MCKQTSGSGRWIFTPVTGCTFKSKFPSVFINVSPGLMSTGSWCLKRFPEGFLSQQTSPGLQWAGLANTTPAEAAPHSTPPLTIMWKCSDKKSKSKEGGESTGIPVLMNYFLNRFFPPCKYNFTQTDHADLLGIIVKTKSSFSELTPRGKPERGAGDGLSEPKTLVCFFHHSLVPQQEQL